MKALMAEVVDTGQKRDRQGRRIERAEHRAALIAAYEKSGLTQRAFAEREGVKFFTFAAWLAKHRRAAKPAFAEVTLRSRMISSIGSTPGLEVVLRDGVVVRGSDLEAVAGLVERLRRC
jgi:hypothetical protein